MKRPLGISWMQIAAVLTCYALAFTEYSVAAIVGVLVVILGELTMIRQSLVKQAAAAPPEGKESK